jgi:hypothetical protein
VNTHGVRTSNFYSSTAYSFYGPDNSTSQRIKCNSILASNAWADEPYVPHLGIFARGDISSAGNITAWGNVTAYSDKRIKEDVTVIENALTKVEQLNGVTFKRKDTLDRQTGLLAQEVEAVLPEAVTRQEASEEIKAKMKETKLLKGSWGNMDACRTEESVSKGVKTKRLKHDLYFIPINRVDKSGNIIKSYDTIYDAVDDIRSLGVECQAKKIARIFNSDIHHSHPRGYFWELQERSTTSLYGVDSSESKQETLLSEDIV